MNAKKANEDLNKRLGRATEQVKNEDLDAAIITLKALLQEYPNNEISTGMLASIYLQIGMNDLAIELYESLLETSPDNPLARFQLGLANLNKGNTEVAIDIWHPMLKMENEFMAHFHSALAYIELGNHNKALDLLQVAGQHMPNSHPFYSQMVTLHKTLSGAAN